MMAVLPVLGDPGRNILGVPYIPHPAIRFLKAVDVGD
jgi:hypothetical protein